LENQHINRLLLAKLSSSADWQWLKWEGTQWNAVSRAAISAIWHFQDSPFERTFPGRKVSFIHGNANFPINCSVWIWSR